MTDHNHCCIVASSLKIAVEQAGNHSGVSLDHTGVVIKTPMASYSVGMHHENASLHPRVPEFIDPFHTCSERAVIATEAFGLAIVQEVHRNITNPGSRNFPFPWTKLHNGSCRPACLSKSLINETKCGCHACSRLRTKDDHSLTSSLFGERAVSQSIDNHRSQNSLGLENVPSIAAQLLMLNSNTDPAGFKSECRLATTRRI